MYGGHEPTFLWFNSPLELMLSQVLWKLGKPGFCLSPTAPWRFAPGSFEESALARLEAEREGKYKQILALQRLWRGGRVGENAPFH